MRLELADFPVREVRFSRHTGYDSGILEIEKEEMIRLIMEDARIAAADLEVAFPGEKTRIVRVRDAVEPRVKVSGRGGVFPGILGPVETVGEGRTHRLSGVTVMPSAEYHPTIPTGTGGQRSGLVDMWGPGAKMSRFGSMINIVLVFKLIDGVTELEAHTAIQSAELRVAQRLAETTREKTAEKVEVFELFKTDPSLPRVVYILGVVTEVAAPHSSHAYYGMPIRESLSTLIHPNELLDGALTTDARRGAASQPTTWEYMNHPVVFGLLRRHGKDLNFLGVILQKTRFEAEWCKRVGAECASQMARILEADGAIITRVVPSGNNFVDVMLTVQACEKKGVKVVLLTPEWGGREGTETPLVFYVPEATAMVTTGSKERETFLPAPEKVIGVREGESVELYAGEPFSPWREGVPPAFSLIGGGVDWLGGMHRTCKQY